MVLVLGGAGYIGSHVAKLLRQRGVAHLVVDSLESGHREAVGGSPFEKADIRRPEEMRAVFQRHPIEAVLLFAGYVSVGESMREPGKYFRNNVGGAINLLEAMREAGVPRILYSSSAAVYGEPSQVPIPEEHPLQPTSVYGETKLIVERLLRWYGEAHGFKSVSLRYFNAAGADPEGELGEDHRPEQHLIPVAIEAAMGLRDKLVIFGSDYDTPDGTCIRDYIHVSDLAEAHLLAMDSLQDSSAEACRAYNLGSGSGFSVRKVIDAVARVCGKPVPFEVGPRRPGDPARLVASSDKIRAELRWEPRYDDLDTIVAHAYNWRSANPHGYGS